MHAAAGARPKAEHRPLPPRMIEHSPPGANTEHCLAGVGAPVLVEQKDLVEDPGLKTEQRNWPALTPTIEQRESPRPFTEHRWRTFRPWVEQAPSPKPLSALQKEGAAPKDGGSTEHAALGSGTKVEHSCGPETKVEHSLLLSLATEQRRSFGLTAEHCPPGLAVVHNEPAGGDGGMVEFGRPMTGAGVAAAIIGIAEAVEIR